MIITYCTDNYYRWATLFLESWKRINGESEKIWINGNLSDGQAHNLHKIYQNLYVNLTPIDMEEVATTLGMSVEELSRRRVEVQEGIRKGRNRLVMNHFAVDERVMHLYNTIHHNSFEPYFIQCDIDLIFRKPIEITGPQDVGLLFQPHKSEMCRRIAFGIQFLNNTTGTRKLVGDWLGFVKAVPPLERDIADLEKALWGQYTFYQAWMKNKDKLSSFALPLQYLDNMWNKDSEIWSANRRLSGSKTNTYEHFRKEVFK